MNSTGRFGIFLVVCIWLAQTNAISEEEELSTDLIGLNTSEIFRKRGYGAEDHFVEVTGGYILNVVHAWNPLITEVKKTILMIHGIYTNANCFLVNSIGARPKDNSSIDFDALSLEELYELFDGDPNGNSLPFLGLNNGMDFWVVNRRGTNQSMGQVNKDMQPYITPLPSLQTLLGSIIPGTGLESSLLSFFANLPIPGTNVLSDLVGSISSSNTVGQDLVNFDNPKFWEFAMDEQAKYDIPQVVYYILRKLKRKRLSIVGHSAGAALPLMSLVVEPELADCLEQAHLWGPALDLGDSATSNPFYSALTPLVPIISNTQGPFPSTGLMKVLTNLLSKACTPPAIRDSVCARFSGDGASQQMIYPSLIYNYFQSISIRDLAQLGQSGVKGTMHFYDFIDKETNMRRYGQPEPPQYNISKITFRGLSLWSGNADYTVTPGTVGISVNRLKVPLDVHHINQTGVIFNHVSFLAHRNVSKLLIIPTLKSLSRIFRG